MQRNTAPYKQLFVNEICHGVSSAKVTVHSHVLLTLEYHVNILACNQPLGLMCAATVV